MGLAELPVAAHMVKVAVGVDKRYRFIRKSVDNGFYVAKAHAGIEKQRTAASLNEKAGDLLKMAGFKNGRDPGQDPVGDKPPAFAGEGL